MTSSALETAGKITAAGAGGFVFGCVVGAIIKAPILLSGATWGVSFLANMVFNEIVEHRAAKDDWLVSNREITLGIGNLILGTAFLVSAFALGVLGTTGLAVVGVLFGISVGARIGYAIYLKASGKDMTVEEEGQLKRTRVAPSL